MSPKERAERRYWERVRDKAGELGTDGCSGATGAFVECCYEHDIHWRTGKTLDGRPITEHEANKRFRNCMQSRSRFGFFSPVAWWRWAAVSLVGKQK
jgi:hypothetical protein